MKVVTGISVDEEVLWKAKLIAKSTQRNFSNYVEWLMVEHQNNVAHQYPDTASHANQIKRKNCIFIDSLCFNSCQSWCAVDVVHCNINHTAVF